MKEKMILDTLSNVNETYIQEANPLHKTTPLKHYRKYLIAACFCLFLCGAFGINQYKNNTLTYYAANMEEISSVYNGVLLAENLSYSDAINTDIALCYAGTGSSQNIEDWKTLSVSADYEGYNITMNCFFDEADLPNPEAKVADIIQYGDTSIYLYENKTDDEYSHVYRAVFKYDSVFYELYTYSNDPSYIYDLLEIVLKEPKTTSDTPFSDILGYSNYYVEAEEGTPGFVHWNYYTKIEGEKIYLAEVFGYVVPEPEVYSKDLDGDGINELICNCMYGTGATRVYVYRNNDGVIERGWLAYDTWDATLFPDISNRGASYLQEKYIVDNNTFTITYPTETDNATIVLEDLDMFEFEPFVVE